MNGYTAAGRRVLIFFFSIWEQAMKNDHFLVLRGSIHAGVVVKSKQISTQQLLSHGTSKMIQNYLLFPSHVNMWRHIARMNKLALVSFRAVTRIIFTGFSVQRHLLLSVDGHSRIRYPPWFLGMHIRTQINQTSFPVDTNTIIFRHAKITVH